MPKTDPAPAPKAPITSVKTLSRGLEILNLFTEGESVLSQTDIAAQCGLPLPTVHRLVGTLVTYGYLEQIPGGRGLRLGETVMLLAGRLTSRNDSAAVIRQSLQRVSAELEETVNLAVLLGPSVVYLDGVAGPKLLTPNTAVGERISAHNTALGKALLAQLEDEEILERIGEGPYDGSTSRTATDWSALKERIEEVRRTGIAISDEEFEIGLTSIAVALPPLPDGTPRGMNVSLPLSRASESFRTKAIDLLQQSAREISAS